MVMEGREEKAVELFNSGYNCAQSVFGAYADVLGLDPDMAFSISSPLGGGLAGMRHVCGTVCAMSMAAGLKNGNIDPKDKEKKKAATERVKMLAEEFTKENGSIICRQLRGMEPGLAEGKTPKPCVEYIRTSARLISKYLTDREREAE